MLNSLSEVYAAGMPPDSCIQGWQWSDENSCRDYFGTRIRKRLKESDAGKILQEYLERMPETGFDKTRLVEEVQQPREPRDWEIGEAIAEVIMEDHQDCRFPWRVANDAREDQGNPTGPDLPGFLMGGDDVKETRFAFGEVKSSSHKDSPPLVVHGIGENETSLVAQVKRLLVDARRRQKLIAWLKIRCDNKPEWSEHFSAAVTQYFGNSALMVFGCLVRGGVDPSSDDLRQAELELKASLGTFELRLRAYYLPFRMADWVGLLVWGNANS